MIETVHTHDTLIDHVNNDDVDGFIVQLPSVKEGNVEIPQEAFMAVLKID